MDQDGQASISAPFVVLGAFVSGSRLGIVGCLIGLAVYGGVWAYLRWRRHPGSLLGPAILLAYPVIAGLGAASILFVGRIHNLVWGSGAEAYSDLSRKGQIDLGIPLILKQPWGYGIGRGAETLGFAPFGVLTIDNYYLRIVLEYGVFGFIAYYGMFIAAIVYSGRRVLVARFEDPEFELLTPIAISLLTFIIIKSVFSEEGNHPIAFMLLGMSAALLYRARSSVVARSAVPAPQSTRRGRAPALPGLGAPRPQWGR